MRFKVKQVILSRIDSGDESFRITTAADSDDLMASIQDVGLLNPPLLLGKGDNYIIVSGFRRVEACQRLGRSQINARVVDSATSRAECVRFAITDNAFQRPLNLVEQSRSIHLLSGFFDDHQALAKELSALGLPENPSIIEKLKRVCHLSPSIQSGILSNTISLATALELGKFGQDAGDRLAVLLQGLKLSLNRQREIIFLVKEIALRDDVSIPAVLEDQGVIRILDNEAFDRNQKARKFRAYLRQRRFPSLTEAERKFEGHVKELKLGSGIQLIPPANFEGSGYTLKLSFKNLTELHHRKAAFDAILEHPSLAKILG